VKVNPGGQLDCLERCRRLIKHHYGCATEGFPEMTGIWVRELREETHTDGGKIHTTGWKLRVEDEMGKKRKVTWTN
jgi:hypothetical protein